MSAGPSVMGSSLERTLATVLRRGVPEGALACVGAADKALLEHIALLAQQVLPELDVTRAEACKTGETYTLRLPWGAGDVRVSLASLRDIESYSPYRILDVSVRGGEHACVSVQVATENRPLVFSEVDIVRIKRRRV
jgi:hypothetical protein